MPELDIESIAAAVREEAERKIGVLHLLVERHTAVIKRREEFLAADAADTAALTELVAEAQRAGLDGKTLRPFAVEPLTAGPRRRAPGRPRRPRAAAEKSTQVVSPPNVNEHSDSGASSEQLAPTG